MKDFGMLRNNVCLNDNLSEMDVEKGRQDDSCLGLI